MRNKKALVVDPNKIFSEAGSDELITYDSKINPDGTVSLVQSGKESISLYINSFKDQTDMSYIIKRIQLGDLSVLNKARGVFGDFSDMPKTYAETLQLKIDAERAFDNLPAEVKKQFNNSFNQWFMNAGSEDWLKLMTPANYEQEGEVTASVEDTP